MQRLLFLGSTGYLKPTPKDQLVALPRGFSNTLPRALVPSLANVSEEKPQKTGSIKPGEKPKTVVLGVPGAIELAE